MMLLYTVIFLFIVYLNESTGIAITENKEWSFIVFAQHWPPAVCSINSHRECVVPVKTGWAVHGIWPTSEHGYPTYCNRSWNFNISQIKSIESDLDVAWPNIFPETSSYSFWKHEWLKHGTCAVSLPTLDNEFKYFKMAIEWHNLYNIKSLLEQNNIIPDKTKIYQIDDIKTAFLNQFGKIPTIECSSTKGYSAPLLSTISLCLDKNFNIIDCEMDVKFCKKTSVIYLPPMQIEVTPTPYVNLYHIFIRSNFYRHISTDYYMIAGMLLIVVCIILVYILILSRRHIFYNKLIK